MSQFHHRLAKANEIYKEALPLLAFSAFVVFMGWCVAEWLSQGTC